MDASDPRTEEFKKDWGDYIELHADTQKVHSRLGWIVGLSLLIITFIFFQIDYTDFKPVAKYYAGMYIPDPDTSVPDPSSIIEPIEEIPIVSMPPLDLPSEGTTLPPDTEVIDPGSLSADDFLPGGDPFGSAPAGNFCDDNPCPAGFPVCCDDLVIGHRICCKSDQRCGMKDDSTMGCEDPCGTDFCMPDQQCCGTTCIPDMSDCCDPATGTHCWEGECCGPGCTPAGGTCCDDTTGRYCEIGYHCRADGDCCADDTYECGEECCYLYQDCVDGACVDKPPTGIV